MGGFETTAAIREREKHTGAHIPIIAMTAHAMVGDRERCLTAGMDGYLAKPVKSGELFDLLERIVEFAASGVPVLPTARETDTLLDSFGGDRELLAETAGTLISYLPGALDELREAVRRRDGPAIRRAAHDIKGALSNFPWVSATDAARQLESMGRNNDLAHSDAVFDTLDAECVDLRELLRVRGIR